MITFKKLHMTDWAVLFSVTIALLYWTYSMFFLGLNDNAHINRFYFTFVLFYLLIVFRTF